MKHLIKHLSVLLIIQLFATVSIFGQSEYKINGSNSSIQINGGSTLHDWEMDVSEFTGDFKPQVTDNKLLNIKKVKFSASVQDIEADKNLMESKAHNALKKEDHPKITFEYTSLKRLRNNGSNFSGKLDGLLSIAGENRIVSIPFSGAVQNSGSIKVKGNLELNMTDYNVEPPSAMLGSVKTDEKVTISYNFQFEKASKFTETLDN